MTIISELLDESLCYVLKCTNNIQDMSRKQLEYRIIGLENRVDELQTEEYFIVDDMIDQKIVNDGSWLFDVSNHELFFEDLVSNLNYLNQFNSLNYESSIAQYNNTPLVHTMN